jgi:uncharacterized protein YvpB
LHFGSGRDQVRTPVTVLAVLAILFSTFAGFISPASAQASELTHLGGWATLGSATPAPGCWVDAAVEVRRGGFAIPNVEVGVSLVHNGEIVSSDYGVTDGQGLAYLGVDTSWGAPGLDAWLDVLIGGQYAGGMALRLTEGGSCSDNPDMVEIGAQVPVWESSDTVEASSAPASPSSEAVSFYVPTYVQQRNLSCEYASLVIAMGAYGVWVSEYEFDSIVGTSENPHWGFRGDITGWWGNTDDYGVYAAALAPALPRFGFSGEVFYGQGNPTALTARLDEGVPVLVWVGLWGDTGFYDYTADGTRYKLAAGQHVVVAYGYDSGGVYIADPATGGKHYYDWATFMTYWNVLDGMALAVRPL